MFIDYAMGMGTENLIKFMMYGTGGATFLFGAWMPLVGILLTLVAIDIITGICKGFYDKSLRSRKMSQGMISKAMYFVVLIIANMIDLIVSGGMPIAKTGVLLFYIGLEGLSILENLGQMNVPLPRFIKSYLIVLRDKGNDGNTNSQIKVPPSDSETTLEFKEVNKDKEV